MQITGAQKRRVALFFIFGAFIVISIVALLVGNRLLKREKCFHTRFTNVSVAGLGEGASVKFQGMDVGNVSQISVDPLNTAVIRIDFCLKPGIPIREGTSAQLGNIGITGLKFVELTGGGKGEMIPEEGEIPSSRSSWDTISGKATVVIAKLESILNQVNDRLEEMPKGSVAEISRNVGGITGTLNRFLKKNEREFSSVIRRTDSLLAKLDQNAKNLQKTTADLPLLLGKDGKISKTLDEVKSLAGNLNSTVDKTPVEETFKRITSLMQSVQETMNTVNLTLMRSQEDIASSFENLSEGMTNFNDFTRAIMENPSTLIKGKEESGK